MFNRLNLYCYLHYLTYINVYVADAIMKLVLLLQ